MLDIARAIVVFYALVQAVRHRFVIGIVFSVLIALAMALVACGAYTALLRHEVNGEYAFALVYIGPTMLPFGGREWLPIAMQFALALASAVPALTALRSPSNPVTTPFLLVFMPNSILTVLACLGGFLEWRQEASFPEYWENSSLAGRSESRPRTRLVLRPGSDEHSLVSVTSQTRVTLLVRNLSDEDIRLFPIDLDGRRDLGSWERESAPPGTVIEASSWASHAFVITNNAGDAMCTFVLGREDAVADVDGPCH